MNIVINYYFLFHHLSALKLGRNRRIQTQIDSDLSSEPKGVFTLLQTSHFQPSLKEGSAEPEQDEHAKSQNELQSVHKDVMTISGSKKETEKDNFTLPPHQRYSTQNDKMTVSVSNKGNSIPNKVPTGDFHVVSIEDNGWQHCGQIIDRYKCMQNEDCKYDDILRSCYLACPLATPAEDCVTRTDCTVTKKGCEVKKKPIRCIKLSNEECTKVGLCEFEVTGTGDLMCTDISCSQLKSSRELCVRTNHCVWTMVKNENLELQGDCTTRQIQNCHTHSNEAQCTKGLCHWSNENSKCMRTCISIERNQDECAKRTDCVIGGDGRCKKAHECNVPLLDCKLPHCRIDRFSQTCQNVEENTPFLFHDEQTRFMAILMMVMASFFSTLIMMFAAKWIIEMRKKYVIQGSQHQMECYAE